MKIACSDEQLCYVGCECKTANGWSGGSTMSANGTLSTASAGSELNSDYTIKDDGAAKKTTSSATPGISTMAVGGSCTISVTDPRYGLTCRKASTYDCNNVCGGSAYYYCPTGSSSPSCSTSQYEYDVGVQKCTSGSSTNSTHCYTCKNCSWVCPDNTYTTAPNGYYLPAPGLVRLATNLQNVVPATIRPAQKRSIVTATPAKLTVLATSVQSVRRP